MEHRSPYAPGAHGTPLPDLAVRAARADDAAAVARIEAEWRPEPESELATRIRRDLQRIAGGGARAYTCVAVVPEGIAGYGKCAWLAWEPDAEPRLPDGWYLNGVTVARRHRRRGIGRALVAHRLAWLRGRAEEVYYVTGEPNRVSQDLHASFGFREVRRGFRWGRGHRPEERDVLFCRALAGAREV